MSLARRQLSLFGVEAADPSPFDLAGLLLGPARLTRMGGTARLAVTVDAAWRVHVLAAELALRGVEISWRPVGGPPEDRPQATAAAQERSGDDLPDDDWPPREPSEQDEPAAEDSAAGQAGREPAGQAGREPAGQAGREPAGQAGREPPGGDAADGGADGEPAPESREPAGGGSEAVAAGGGYEVLTAYSRNLAPLRRPLFVNGARLRLWVAAAGTVEPGAVTLALDPVAEPPPVEAVLARAGLAGALIADGRAVRITGRRRLDRLAELVGERPAAAPPGAWPSPDG